jgi:hypothetical protein
MINITGGGGFLGQHCELGSAYQCNKLSLFSQMDPVVIWTWGMHGEAWFALAVNLWCAKPGVVKWHNSSGDQCLQRVPIALGVPTFDSEVKTPSASLLVLWEIEGVSGMMDEHKIEGTPSFRIERDVICWLWQHMHDFFAMICSDSKPWFKLGLSEWAWRKNGLRLGCGLVAGGHGGADN